MRAFRTLLLLSFIAVCDPALAGAPPPPTTTGGGTPDCWPPPCVPVDGGIGLLMLAGAAYGAKKFHDKHRSSRAA